MVTKNFRRSKSRSYCITSSSTLMCFSILFPFTNSFRNVAVRNDLDLCNLVCTLRCQFQEKLFRSAVYIIYIFFPFLLQVDLKLKALSRALPPSSPGTERLQAAVKQGVAQAKVTLTSRSAQALSDDTIDDLVG